MQRSGVLGRITDRIAAWAGARGLVAAAALGAALAAGGWLWQHGAERLAAAAALERGAAAAEARLVDAFARLDAALARLAAGADAAPEGTLARWLGLDDGAGPPDALDRPALAVPAPLLEAALADETGALLGPFPDPLGGEAVLVRALALGAGPERRVALAEIPGAAVARLLAEGLAGPLRLRVETPSGLRVASVPLETDAPEGANAIRLRRPLGPAGLALVASMPAAGGRLAGLAGTAALGGLILAGAVALARAHAARSRPSEGAGDGAARLAAAVEALPEAFVLWDESDRLVACNARFRALFPLRPGARLRPGMARDAAAEALLPAARLADGGSPFALAPAPAEAPPAELRLADGRWLLAGERQVPGGGRVALFRDASALVRANAELAAARDEAQAAAAARARLLGHVSHELRAPLASLLALADELGREAELSEGPRRQAVLLGAAARHLLALANEVLDLGALEASSLTLKPEEVPPRRPLEEAIEIATPLAAARRVRLAFQAGDLPARARLDPARLRQVVLNLLTNAVKFSPEHAVVRLEAHAAGGRLHLSVTDQGPGVPPAEEGRLFRDFSRLQPEAAEGAGLGLAISARLVALMGGDIRSEARAGAGGRFVVELPLGAAAPAAPPVPRPAVREGRLRVLAVDDSPANLSVMRALLSTTGFRFDPRGDGPAGIEALTAAAAAGQPHDVVLMDVMMPGMDGLETTRRIRALPGPLGRVPVIAVTASAFPEDVAACLAAGMNGHVPKPVERMALLRAIAAAVAGETDAQDLAALRPSFLAELAGRLAEIERGGAAVAESVHAIAGTVGLLGASDLLEEARAAVRALRERSPEASGSVDQLARRIAARFPELRAPVTATA